MQVKGSTLTPSTAQMGSEALRQATGARVGRLHAGRFRSCDALAKTQLQGTALPVVGSVWRRSLKCGGAAGGRDGLVLYLDGDGGSLDCIYTGESVRYKGETTRCGNYILTFFEWKGKYNNG